MVRVGKQDDDQPDNAGAGKPNDAKHQSYADPVT
jgi:hypothetical protein